MKKKNDEIKNLQQQYDNVLKNFSIAEAERSKCAFHYIDLKSKYDELLSKLKKTIWK